jgi:starch synthase
MQVIHISAECYPAAKAGGLGDVVGALPKYLSQAGHPALVIIPKYKQKWILNQPFERIFSTLVRLGDMQVPAHVDRYTGNSLGFGLLTVDIPGFFDREGIYIDTHTGYGYSDEAERYVLFQQTVLKFLLESPEKPDIIHCHDHHTGLIPFMIKHCPEYRALSEIPTMFTIHNGQYHGAFSWSKSWILPWYDANANGLLEWDHNINPLACAIKCCWKFSTVSGGYLNELRYAANGLESLINMEFHKAYGIVNGIDNQVWDPKNDPLLAYPLVENIDEYKALNKQVIAERFAIQADLPLITFIGRLVGEKGADLIPGAIMRFLEQGGQASFVVLGTGDPALRDVFMQMRERLWSYFDTSIEYNEQLSHQLYAGSDFLMMPSRVEPCGLNQLYSFRYGTIPIVRSIGGLAETVIDVTQWEGNGLRFDDLSEDALCRSFHRAAELYHRKDILIPLRERIMKLDFSWEKAADTYIAIYKSLQPSFA